MRQRYSSLFGFFVIVIALFCVTNAAITDEQKRDANSIISYFTKGQGKGKTYDWMARFTDKYADRHSPGPGYDAAVVELLAQLRAAGFDRVWTEDAPGIPNWFRVNDPNKPDQAVLIKPRRHVIPVLPLGNSTATPPDGGIKSAPVVVVQTFDQLAALPNDRIKGSIVVYNQPWLGSYHSSVEYRAFGATEAAKRGAIAALVRSITPFSLYTLHTGGILYSNDSNLQIPVGSITVEDAELLYRLQTAGHQLEMSLQINTVYKGIISKPNVLAEVRGKTKPDEVVVFGGHLDAWDVGSGAMDDGGGVAISYQAITAMTALGLRPKRTMRVVFWTAEELGYMGSNAYYEAHKHESEKMSLGMECDTGTFTPTGFHFGGNAEAKAMLQEVMDLLTPINATELAVDGILPGEQELFYENNGVPVVELKTRYGIPNERYFWYHHTEADMMTIANSDDLDSCSALFATVAYVVADLDELLPHGKD